ncbi:hypothetical protein Micbo1qcDRAFT_170837 [Microdochium bolleyi]|uniref:Uncharacterized protein n=1 Tax=Microdochium bolleyi TaxID=196109 RepID=A0A136JJ02_9PEZI|nr:hypothetical protein Micbo1qcDRAFT_170837 [Microdochium bolleyi]
MSQCDHNSKGLMWTVMVKTVADIQPPTLLVLYIEGLSSPTTTIPTSKPHHRGSSHSRVASSMQEGGQCPPPCVSAELQDDKIEGMEDAATCCKKTNRSRDMHYLVILQNPIRHAKNDIERGSMVGERTKFTKGGPICDHPHAVFRIDGKRRGGVGIPSSPALASAEGSTHMRSCCINTTRLQPTAQDGFFLRGLTISWHRVDLEAPHSADMNHDTSVVPLLPLDRTWSPQVC